MKLNRRQWLLGGAGAATLGSWLWMRDATSSQTEIRAMKSLTEPMRTHCIGRFLIDAPLTAQTDTGNYGFPIASVEASRRPQQTAAMVLETLDGILSKREAELLGQPPTYSGSKRFLGRWRGGAAVRVIQYMTPGNESAGLADGYVARDSGLFSFQTSAYEQAHATELLNYLVEIEPTLSILGPGELPRTPGFCIGKGLVASNPSRGESVVGWAWDLGDHPDVSFGLSSSTNGDKVEEGILDREAGILREAGGLLLMHVKTLRKRRFDLSGMPAQEWLVEITDDHPQYSFDLEIPGRPKDNAHPSIKLSMQVGGHGGGGYRKPSLSTGEALALWDALIVTLRLRPGAF